MKKEQLAHISAPRSTTLYLILFCLPFLASAQANQAMNTDVPVYICPTCSSSTPPSAVATLNADMWEINTSQDQLEAIAWGDATGGGGASITTGFVVFQESVGLASGAWVSLPANSHDPDIVLGKYNDPMTGTKYIVGVIYENGGDIYIRSYTISGIGSTLSVSALQTSSALNSNTGTAFKPHMDLFADNTYSYNNGDYAFAHEFGAVWHEKPSSQNVVTFYRDDLANLTGGCTTTVTSDGQDADVACTSSYPGTGGSWVAHVVYTDNAGTSLYENDVTTGCSAGSPVTLESSITRALTPRIECNILLNTIPAQSGQPEWFAVAATRNGGGNPEVFGYNYYWDAGMSAYTLATFNYSTTFSSSGDEYLLPTICGTGGPIPAGLGHRSSGGDYYNIGYYSTYTYNPMTSPQYGDFYCKQEDMPFSHGNPNAEVNLLDLTGNGFSYTGPMPAMAVATCSNSGYDLMATFFDAGTGIYYKLDNPMMQFKHANGISTVETKEYALFPNPATTKISVQGMKKADYTITDAAGRIVGNGKVSTTGNNINVSNFTPGMYFINLTEDGATQRIKFAKQ